MSNERDAASGDAGDDGAHPSEADKALAFDTLVRENADAPAFAMSATLASLNHSPQWIAKHLHLFSGMTKRELFTAFVLMGAAADPRAEWDGPEETAATVVGWVDAALAELERTK